MATGNTLVNRYDAENLRVEIEENEKLTRFIFHRDEILVEATKEDAPISRFIRGYDIVSSDISVAGQSDANADFNASSRYYYHQDEQFSTSFITNGNGGIENRYSYDAFGNTLENEENVHNQVKYTGQQYDPITQQYYLRARFYNPILSRFMQEDVYRGDGLNLYAYCRNNPVMYYDPSGYDARYGEQSISDAEKAKLRANIPTDEIRFMVNEGLDVESLPIPDKAIPGKMQNKKNEADHIQCH